jgi:hypothetical protein
LVYACFSRLPNDMLMIVRHEHMRGGYIMVA